MHKTNGTERRSVLKCLTLILFVDYLSLFQCVRLKKDNVKFELNITRLNMKYEILFTVHSLKFLMISITNPFHLTEDCITFNAGANCT